MRRLALATKTQVKRYKETRLGTKSVATLAVGLQMFATCLWPRFLPTVFEPNLLFGLGLWVSFFFLGKRKWAQDVSDTGPLLGHNWRAARSHAEQAAVDIYTKVIPFENGDFAWCADTSGRGWRCKAIFRSQGKSGWCLAIWPCDFKGWQGAKCCRGFYTCGSERLETSRSKNLLVLAGVSIRIWRLLSQTRGRHRKSAGKQETSRGSSENPLHHFKEVWRCPQQQRVTARRVGTRCQISVGSAQKAGPRYFGMNYHTSSPQGLQVATNG